MSPTSVGPSTGRSLHSRQTEWLGASDRPHGHQLIFLGNLNVLEPGHQPHYPFFAQFEYDFYRALTNRHGLTDAFRHLHPDATEHSWVDRTGHGYRDDYLFCSAQLAHAITDCAYLHDSRTSGLSDHSALTATLAIHAPPERTASDPAIASAPATLF
jgi:exodeoxyribonuclease III